MALVINKALRDEGKVYSMVMMSVKITRKHSCKTSVKQRMSDNLGNILNNWNSGFSGLFIWTYVITISLSKYNYDYITETLQY